jgi:hypothetical protein
MVQELLRVMYLIFYVQVALLFCSIYTVMLLYKINEKIYEFEEEM